MKVKQPTDFNLFKCEELRTNEEDIIIRHINRNK